MYWCWGLGIQKKSRKDVRFALKHLVSGQEEAVRGCCTMTQRWKPEKMLNFAQLSTRARWPPSLSARLHEMWQRKHRRSLPRWASLSDRSVRQRSPLKAEAAPGTPLSDASQMLVLQQEHLIPLSPCPQRGMRESARARSLRQTSLLGTARPYYSNYLLII